MAEDKLINVVIKYSTLGAQEAADAFASVTGVKTSNSGATQAGATIGNDFSESFKQTVANKKIPAELAKTLFDILSAPGGAATTAGAATGKNFTDGLTGQLKQTDFFRLVSNAPGFVTAQTAGQRTANFQDTSASKIGFSTGGEVDLTSVKAATEATKNYSSAVYATDEEIKAFAAQQAELNKDVKTGAENLKEMGIVLDEKTGQWKQVTQATTGATGEVDKNSEAAKKGAQAVKGYNAELADTNREFRAIRYGASAFQQLGTMLAVGGGLITAAITLEANNYVKAMGQTTALSAEWLGYQKQISEQNMRIGETATQALLPAMKAAADLMKNIADIVQQNPWIVSAVLGVAAVMTVVGTSAALIARIVIVIDELTFALSTLGLMQAKQQAMELGSVAKSIAGPSIAADVAAGAGAAGGISLGTIGAIIAIGAVFEGAAALLLRGVESVSEKFGATAEQAKLLSFIVSELLGPLGLAGKAINDVIDKFPEFIKGLKDIASTLGLGGIFGANTVTSPTTGSTMGTDTDIHLAAEVDAYINYEKQIAAAQTNYAAQRADTIQQYEQQMADTTARYELQRASIIENALNASVKAAENFARANENALSAYNDQVAKTEASARLSALRAAQDHARAMQQLAQQHNIRIFDLAAARDALGMVKENQSYALQRSQKETDYSIQRQRAAENLAIQLADMRVNYERQRAQRLDAYQQQKADAAKAVSDQLAKLDDAHKLEMKKLDENEKQKLEKMDEAYKKQMNSLQTNFVDQIDKITQTILGNTQAWTDYMHNEAVKFRAWLAGMQSGGAGGSASPYIIPGSGRAIGGYASFFGAGENGLPEYVLSNPTVRAMEGMMGGRLSQASLLASVMAGKNPISNRGGNGSLTVNVTSQSLTVSQIRYEIDNALNQKLGDLLPAFGA